MNHALVEHFRLPQELIHVRLRGPLSREPGYFRFAADTICYGRSASGSRTPRAHGKLYDTAGDVVAEGGAIRLPFDPDEVVDNLRHERYLAGGGRSARESPYLRSLYYGWLRPLVPAPVRRRLQRALLGDWDRIPFPQWPVDGTVDRLLERLLAVSMTALGLARVPFIWFWPDGATACAIMTHDVDDRAGLDFCSELMALDDAVAIKSSFQIVPEGRYPVADALLHDIRARGFEVNVHDLNHDGRLFTSREEFSRRVERINAWGRRYQARGFRSGQLYRNQAWLSELAFSYDMSVPSVAHLDPQRGGCCTLTPFFIGKVLELPLTTIQDYSLFYVLRDYSTRLWTRQADEIAARHGLLSFLVHPEHVIEASARKTYRALLEYLAGLRETRNVWIPLPREVDRWWRQRRALTLVRDGDGWRIEGDGKERARLAFATVTDGKLAFTIDGAPVDGPRIDAGTIRHASIEMPSIEKPTIGERR